MTIPQPANLFKGLCVTQSQNMASKAQILKATRGIGHSIFPLQPQLPRLS